MLLENKFQEESHTFSAFVCPVMFNDNYHNSGYIKTDALVDAPLDVSIKKRVYI